MVALLDVSDASRPLFTHNCVASCTTLRVLNFVQFSLVVTDD